MSDFRKFIYDIDKYLDDDELAVNGPGYNPNRDDKTGRFTFGPAGPKEKALRDVEENETSSPSPDELYDYIDGNLPEREGDPYKGWDYDNSFEGMSKARRDAWINDHVIQNTESDYDEEIAAYVGKKDYSAVNTYLRNPEFMSHPNHADEVKRINGLVERLKRATNADTVQKPMSTYRAGIFTEDYMNGLRPGTYVKDKGIVSTSMSAIYSTEFGARRLKANNAKAADGNGEFMGNILFRVNSQPGQKGIYADTRRTAGGTEFEWIPAYGSQLYITDSVKFTDRDGNFVGGIVDVDVYQDKIPQGYVQTRMFNKLSINALSQEDESDTDRFVWEQDDIELWVPEEEAQNARGYNPNRDEKSGQFTFGPKKQLATIRKREQDIRNNSYETFVAVDGTGKIMLDKKGGKSSVRLTKTEVELLKEADDVVYTHNHPSSASFSKTDLLFGSEIDAKEIRITSEKYEYSFKPGGPDNKFPSLLPSENGWADVGQISQMYDYFNAMAYNKYMPVFKSGKIAEKELWLIHTDEVMENLASELKSTYTRKELQ